METDFGTRLRELRLNSRLNQRDLAAKAGIDVTYLSKIENGRMDPPAEDTVRRLAACLEEDPTELLILARKVPADVREIVTASLEVPAFLRTAKHLNPEQWKILKRGLERDQAHFFRLLENLNGEASTDST